MANEQTIKSTTQTFLDIYDISNNLVVLKDGTTSLIITVDAMNFGLLAEEEQDSIMYAYAGLLNSLNYPIQIIVKSQTKDVTGYLNLLKERENNTFDRTQQKRIMKYREFVSNLIRERNVLDKKFYVVIPAKPLELGLVPISSVVPGSSQTDITTVDKTMVLEKARNILEPKRDHLIAQFARIGLYSRQIETQEIIQLFYQSYNPEAFEGQTMDNSKSYTAPLVSASIEEFPMNNQNQNPGQTQAPVAQQTQEPTVAVPQPTATPENTLPTEQPVATPNVHNNPVATQPSPTAGTDPSAISIPQQPSVSSNEPAGINQAQPAPASVVTTPTTMETNAVTPMNPVSQPVTPPTPNETTTQDQGYTPTQMTGTEPMATPNVQPTIEQDVPVPTPTPPKPELPKTTPGAVDSNVPQETEIKIEHPGEKKAVEQNIAMPQPTNSGEVQVGSQANETTVEQKPENVPTEEMPPLPEIK